MIQQGVEGKALPEGWRWVKLGDVVENIQPGFACGERDVNGIIQLRMNNVNTSGSIDLNEHIRIPKSFFKGEKYLLKPNDVLFNNTNSVELVGKSALFCGYDEPVVYSNHFTRLRPNPEILMAPFLVFWLVQQWQFGIFQELCNRWVGQSAVNGSKLLNLTIPLPPIAEQKRIVEILNDRFSAIETARQALEEQLEAINALPAALLRQAFNGEL